MSEFKVKYPNPEGTHKEIRTLESSTGKIYVSVLIPTVDADRGGYFAKLLAQLKEQTFQDFEVIIVIGDKRQGRAINKAAALAKGELLIILDDDASLGHNTVFENLVKHIEKDPEIGMAGVANTIPKDANWIVRTVMRQVPRRSSEIVSEVVESDMAEHPCCAIPKHVFYGMGGENEIIPRGLDPYLRSEIRKYGYKIVVIPDTFIHHLPPATLSKNIGQFFRNGRQSAFARLNYPEFIVDLTVSHTDDFEEKVGFGTRFFRMLGRVFGSIFRLEFMNLLFMICYYYGFIVGYFFDRKK